MNVQKAKQKMQIQKWSAQVNDQKQSGQTIRQWCNKNGMTIKTFYYHRKRVYEDMLETMETGNALQMSGTTGLRNEDSDINVHEKPVFTALPLPQQRQPAAVTVRMGDIGVDIHNYANDELIERVLRMVSRL